MRKKSTTSKEQVKSVGSFLEILMQGLTVEETIFYVDNVKRCFRVGFDHKYRWVSKVSFSRLQGENKSSWNYRKNCISNEHDNKYLYLPPNFSYCSILGFKYDRAFELLVHPTRIEINANLYEVKSDLLVLTHGLFNNFDQSVVNDF